MKTFEAIIKRIDEICGEQKKSVCDICLKAGMSPSNIYALMKRRTQVSKVDTIKKFCEGANITLREFFAPTYFNDPEDN